MGQLKRIVLIILTIALGATFLYSAFSKIEPRIQPFEYTMVDYLHLPWMAAAIMARLMIGLETGLGILIVLHLFGRNKWVLKAAFTLLIVFSIYLIGLWIKVGNNINCGCFGDQVFMTPSASLIKNGIMLVVTALLIRFHKGFAHGWTYYAVSLLFIGSFVVPFIWAGIPSGQPNWLGKDHYRMDLSILYEPSNNHPPAIKLDSGKHIVAFFSQHCEHCRMAAYKMHLMKQANPSFPFFMIIGGHSDLSEFWKATKAENIPYTRLDKEHFLQYTRGVFPMILWMNNGWVEATADYNTLSQPQIEKWVR